jgi:SHS family lactate transporter-like MFS transporter
MTTRTATPAVLETGHQVAWWKEPTRDQWLAWTAGWLGWTLDAFDFTMFLLLLVPITQAFNVPLVATATVVTLTLWMRLIGAVAAGWLADRIGRKTPLMISIAWYSVCNLLAGLAPSFLLLAGARTLLGIGMGGEWPAGAALAMESWPKRSRGLMSGLLQGSWNLGYLIAAVVFGLLYPIIGWRGMLIIGVLPALSIIYIRAFVKEPEVWKENRRLQREQNREVRAPLVSIFRPPVLANTLSASWWMISSFIVYYSINSLFPTHLQQDLQFDAGRVALPVSLASLVGFLVSPLWGRLSDRIGRRWAAIIPGLITIAVAPFYLLTGDPFLVIFGFTLQGAFGQAIYWLNPIYLAERFPTEVRAVASAFCYHIGAIAGGAVAPILTLLAVNGGLGFGSAMLVGTVLGAVSFAVALIASPETLGTEFAPDLVVA